MTVSPIADPSIHAPSISYKDFKNHHLKPRTYPYLEKADDQSTIRSAKLQKRYIVAAAVAGVAAGAFIGILTAPIFFITGPLAGYVTFSVTTLLLKKKAMLKHEQENSQRLKTELKEEEANLRHEIRALEKQSKQLIAPTPPKAPSALPGAKNNHNKAAPLTDNDAAAIETEDLENVDSIAPEPSAQEQLIEKRKELRNIQNLLNTIRAVKSDKKTIQKHTAKLQELQRQKDALTNKDSKQITVPAQLETDIKSRTIRISAINDRIARKESRLIDLEKQLRKIQSIENKISTIKDENETENVANLKKQLEDAKQEWEELKRPIVTPAAEKVSPEQSSVSTKAPGISTTKAFKKPAPKPPVLTKAQREEAARQAKIRAQKAFEAEQARCQAISSQAEAVQQFIRDMGWNNEQDLNIFQQTAHRVALQGPQLTIPADEAEMPDPIEVSAIGINNLGYTCWLSSALQFFVHHSELADALCNADVSELGVLDKQGDFVAGELRTMQNLLRKIFISLRTQAPEGKRHNVNALLIQDLLVEIDRLDLVKGGGRVPLPNYFNGRQHEAKGFIQELLSAFGLLLPANVDDEKLVKSIKIYTNPTPQDGYYKRPTPMPHSPILSVGVTDGDNEMEFFDLNDMTEKGFIPAEQLVRCSGRTLENGEQQEYEDVKGNPTHAFDYKEYITSLPTNLTISFNRTLRIQQGIDKLERPIFRDQELRKKLKLEPSFTDQIPNCIEMFEYSEDLAYDENGVARAQPTKVCYYKIRGIVVHEAGVIKGAAGVDGGHYVYIRQTEDGTLRRYSDTSIHTIHSLETALEGACFLDLELVEKVDYNEAFDDEEEVVLDASQEFPSYELAELLGTPKNGGQAPATPATAPLSEPHKPTTPKENSTPIPGTFPTVPLDNTLEPTPPLENSSLIPEDSPTVPLDNTLEANSPLVKEEKPQDPEPAPQDKQTVGKTPWFSVIKKIFGTSKQSKAQ